MPTTMIVATAAAMFHQVKIVSLTGMVRPSCSAMKEPSVAAVSGPEADYPMCQIT